MSHLARWHETSSPLATLDCSAGFRRSGGVCACQCVMAGSTGGYLLAPTRGRRSTNCRGVVRCPVSPSRAERPSAAPAQHATTVHYAASTRAGGPQDDHRFQRRDRGYVVVLDVIGTVVVAVHLNGNDADVAINPRASCATAPERRSRDRCLERVAGFGTKMTFPEGNGSRSPARWFAFKRATITAPPTTTAVLDYGCPQARAPLGLVSRETRRWGGQMHVTERAAATYRALRPT
jgi:hypothetical protein